ncbi:MAG TPA: DUF4334 domain-containing protein [Solimonas sp.]|nr:DUF4334 domain-containing protein [Solimonas sp.]
MNHQQQFEQLAASKEKTPLAVLEALFDALPAVEEAFMIGEWSGGVFNTGHPGEQQLPAMRWVGKTFRSRNDVDPIISAGPDGGRIANPIMGSASLRRVEYRGVVTATMCYDKHPVFDHFRKLGERSVLGVMDRKGEDFPLYFYLRRL